LIVAIFVAIALILILILVVFLVFRQQFATTNQLQPIQRLLQNVNRFSSFSFSINPAVLYFYSFVKVLYLILNQILVIQHIRPK